MEWEQIAYYYAEAITQGCFDPLIINIHQCHEHSQQSDTGDKCLSRKQRLERHKQ